jgi:hypothetical protein
MPESVPSRLSDSFVRLHILGVRGKSAALSAELLDDDVRPPPPTRPANRLLVYGYPTVSIGAALLPPSLFGLTSSTQALLHIGRLVNLPDAYPGEGRSVVPFRPSNQGRHFVSLALSRYPMCHALFSG